VPDLEVIIIKIQTKMKKQKKLQTAETQALNIPVVSGSVDLIGTNNTTSIETIGNTTTDTTKIKAGWYSDNFNTYYLDDDGIKHYR